MPLFSCSATPTIHNIVLHKVAQAFAHIALTKKKLFPILLSSAFFPSLIFIMDYFDFGSVYTSIDCLVVCVCGVSVLKPICGKSNLVGLRYILQCAAALYNAVSDWAHTTTNKKTTSIRNCFKCFLTRRLCAFFLYTVRPLRLLYILRSVFYFITITW